MSTSSAWKLLRLLESSDVLSPHRISRLEQVEALALEFKLNGWDIAKPALVGYLWNDEIQLLSGTHRHAAAKLSHTLLPVVVWPYAAVEEAWGTDSWMDLMSSGDGAIVKALEAERVASKPDRA